MTGGEDIKNLFRKNSGSYNHCYKTSLACLIFNIQPLSWLVLNKKHYLVSLTGTCLKERKAATSNIYFAIFHIFTLDIFIK